MLLRAIVDIKPTYFNVVSFSKPPMLRIFGNENWRQYDNQTVVEENVLLEELVDIHPYQEQPKFMANTLFLQHCDKNFVYYHLHKRRFPQCEEVWLNSHPDDILLRLVRDFPKVYITHHYVSVARLDRINYPKNVFEKLNIVSKGIYNEQLDRYNIID
ncbi:MAG: hypothetical protein Homavirus18_6 [Homavirus sp.]|uniref:Uncharacterized protein n=1 Tax=Homavirus sp. TaxID=2487769 RepID=A0A3G5A4R9_9VIRU|nr:MAG: hypothetical protein Homavirus18_6 [Homavirus sp.]